METLRIICVCSGNICRSPMAVAILRERLATADRPAMVISGGTLNIQGRRAADFARSAIKELGEDYGRHIEEHRSQGISAAMLGMADYIVVMSPRHAAAVLKLAPHVARRIVALWEYAPESAGDLSHIPDPVGQGAEGFRASRNLIDACLTRWMEGL